MGKKCSKGPHSSAPSPPLPHSPLDFEVSKPLAHATSWLRDVCELIRLIRGRHVLWDLQRKLRGLNKLAHFQETAYHKCRVRFDMHVRKHFDLERLLTEFLTLERLTRELC